MKEQIKHGEDEKKKLEKKKKDDKKEQAKIISFIEKKKEIEIREESGKKLVKLKELVLEWIITEESATKIESWIALSDGEIKEMFDKIMEIEWIENVDRYIPKDLIVSAREYMNALHDKKERNKVMKKLDDTLDIVSNQIVWWPAMGINLFTWFLSVLDKNLVLIQENTIDLRDTLVKVDESKTKKTA